MTLIGAGQGRYHAETASLCPPERALGTRSRVSQRARNRLTIGRDTPGLHLRVSRDRTKICHPGCFGPAEGPPPPPEYVQNPAMTSPLAEMPNPRQLAIPGAEAISSMPVASFQR
jgi:hypothetical protein